MAIVIVHNKYIEKFIFTFQNLVPDAMPVPEDEVKMLLEDEGPKVEKLTESRGAEALEKLQQIDEEELSPKEVEMAPMLPVAPLSLQSTTEVEDRMPRGIV